MSPAADETPIKNKADSVTTDDASDSSSTASEASYDNDPTKLPQLPINDKMACAPVLQRTGSADTILQERFDRVSQSFGKELAKVRLTFIF